MQGERSQPPPTKCPVCGSFDLKTSPCQTGRAMDSTVQDVLCYRCENGHVFLPSRSEAAGGHS